MSNWIVDIETAGGVASTADELERVGFELDTQEFAPGATASINTQTGVISATFAIEALDAIAAADVCVRAFQAALSASGLGQAEPSRVVVERSPVGSAAIAV